MSAWWALVGTLAATVSLFFALILVEACKDVVKEEARTRIERLPFALLQFAAQRLPADVRDQILYEEWQPELHYIISETNGLPLTRLVRGSRFSLGLLRSARQVGSDLEDVRPEPIDVQFILGMGGVGKTTLIAEMVRRRGDDDWKVSSGGPSQR